MTATKATDHEQQAARETMRFHCLPRVFRAGRLETAGATRERREQQLITANQRDSGQDSESRGPFPEVRSLQFEVRSFQKLPRAPQPPERILKIGFDGRERGVDEIAARNCHHVECPIGRPRRAGRETTAEHFAQPPLGPIAHHRPTNSPRGDDAKPIPLECVGPAQ
jgi:hypothetical protein